MYSKKIKNISKTVADVTNEDVDLVEDLMYFYFNKLRIRLSSLEIKNIQVQGLGLFKLNTKRLRNLIDKEEKQISKMKDKVAISELQEKIDYEKNALEMCEKIDKEKLKFYEERINIKKNLAKQKENS